MAGALSPDTSMCVSGAIWWTTCKLYCLLHCSGQTLSAQMQSLIKSLAFPDHIKLPLLQVYTDWDGVRRTSSYRLGNILGCTDLSELQVAGVLGHCLSQLHTQTHALSYWCGWTGTSENSGSSDFISPSWRPEPLLQPGWSSVSGLAWLSPHRTELAAPPAGLQRDSS